MAKLIRRGVRTGQTKTYETLQNCPNCGKKISSLETNCPHCGATRPAYHTGDTPLERTGKVLQGEDLRKVKDGGGNCQHCGSITWNYDEEKNDFVCPQCSAGTGKKSDYELGGGPASTDKAIFTSPTFQPQRPSSTRERPLWQKIASGAGILVLAVLLIWFIVGIFTTHEVRGQVVSVYWERHAHQEEKQLLQGEGFGLPDGATAVGTPVSKIYDYEENVVGYTHDTYTVTSTPEVTGHTHSMIPAETPGAIYTSEPYDCGSPTEEVGGSVTYDQCVDEYQEESTWGEVESEETPIYAPQVPVEMTTGPTPIYGTPTPIYRDWYAYTYWKWVTTLALPTTSGYENSASWPTGQNDDFHRVVNDKEYYKVVVRYDNGHEETYEGSDSNLLVKYIIGKTVIGKFNIFGFFMGETEFLP